MYPYYKINKRSKKKKCIIYKRTDETEKELNLKVHRKFLFFRYFNNKIPESSSPLIATQFPMHDMHTIYKCVLFSYLSYKDRTKIVFPPEIKIEYEAFDSDVRRIPFFIASDSSINAIIISCRGSSCKDDFITDSLGNGISYNGGRFHEGIFSTASYVFLTCQTKVIELNNLYNDTSKENDDDENSSSNDTYRNYSDDSGCDTDDVEYEEDSNSYTDENYVSYHKSISNENISLNNQSSFSLQKLASSEEINIKYKGKKQKRKLNNDVNSVSNEQFFSNQMSDPNIKPSKKIRRATSSSNLHSNDLDSMSLQRSASSEELFLFFNSIENINENPKSHLAQKTKQSKDSDSNENSKKTKQKSNEDSDSKDKSKKNSNKRKTNKNHDSGNNVNANTNRGSLIRFVDDNSFTKPIPKPNLYENIRKPNSTPNIASQSVRKSTSIGNLSSTRNPLPQKKSVSIQNLHKRFKKLTAKANSDLVFVNKMQKKRTRIIITGHSLGASVAAVVAYLFHEKFPELEVECICFAPPPTLSFNLWRTTGKYVKSFMIEGDVVPFLSVRNLLAISDIMFPHQHSNKKFKKFIVSYLEKKSLEKFHVNKALNEKLYPPGQMYLIRFTDDDEGGLFTLRKRIKKRINKRKNKIEDDDEVDDDHIQLCQILNPDYFSNLVKNIQENNHAVKNYMRLIIRLMNKFRKQNNNR